MLAPGLFVFFKCNIQTVKSELMAFILSWLRVEFSVERKRPSELSVALNCS